MVGRCKKRIRCHPEPFASHLRLLESDGPIRIAPEIGPEPFVCDPERSEGSFSLDSGSTPRRILFISLRVNFAKGLCIFRLY